MADNLVIVESPAKARTIKKYLGKDFEVLASYGHVRDLVPKEGAVDTEHGFTMHYQALEKNERHVEAISRALRKAKSLYLATDPDREGEAIAWHLLEMLKERGEIGTARCIASLLRNHQEAIRAAVAEPREVSHRWSTPSRPAARSTTWWASTSRRCCGRRSVADCPPAGCKVRRCADLRARGGDRSLQGPGILDAGWRGRTFRTGLSAEAHRVCRHQGRAVQLHQRDRSARGRARHPTAAGSARPGGAAQGAGHRPQAAAPQPRPALHHLDVAAGGRAQAGLQRPSHHATRAAAVRGRRHRRGQRRPDHLHAHRLGVAGRRGDQRDPPGGREAVRPGGHRPGAALLQDQVEERAGSARGRASDLGSRSCRRISSATWMRISSSCIR